MGRPGAAEKVIICSMANQLGGPLKVQEKAVRKLCRHPVILPVLVDSLEPEEYDKVILCLERPRLTCEDVDYVMDKIKRLI